MEASFRSRADQSQGGGAAGVHRQTLDGEHGSGKRPERVRGVKEEEKKRVEEWTEKEGLKTVSMTMAMATMVTITMATMIMLMWMGET